MRRVFSRAVRKLGYHDWYRDAERSLVRFGRTSGSRQPTALLFQGGLMATPRDLDPGLTGARCSQLIPMLQVS
jgi:hypothetical protein